MQIDTTIRIHLTPKRMATIKKEKKENQSRKQQLLVKIQINFKPCTLLVGW